MITSQNKWPKDLRGIFTTCNFRCVANHCAAHPLSIFIEQKKTNSTIHMLENVFRFSRLWLVVTDHPLSVCIFFSTAHVSLLLHFLPIFSNRLNFFLFSPICHACPPPTQIELENLNTATEEINKLEIELEVRTLCSLCTQYLHSRVSCSRFDMAWSNLFVPLKYALPTKQKQQLIVFFVRIYRKRIQRFAFCTMSQRDALNCWRKSSAVALKNHGHTMRARNEYVWHKTHAKRPLRTINAPVVSVQWIFWPQFPMLLRETWKFVWNELVHLIIWK